MKKLQTTEKPAKYHLRIIPGVWKTAVISDLKDALVSIRKTINTTTDCEGKEALRKCDTLLWAILTDNE